MKVTDAHMMDPFLMGELLPGYGQGDRDSSAKNIIGGPAWTLWVDDKPIAVMGAVQVHEQCMSVWSLMTTGIKSSPIFVHKTMLKLIENMMDHTDRLQSVVDVGNDVAYKHNLVMGFSYEGTLRKSGYHGQDQIIFGLVRGSDGS